MHPFFSIIIPLYNKEKHIKNTLLCVLRQTFSDFEIIIINDGSTDSSEVIVDSIEDDRIHLISTSNQGVSNARNLGIEKASGECIAFLDADDSWRDDHLNNLKDLYDLYPNCGLYATAYIKRIKNRSMNSEYNTIPTDPKWKGIVPNYFEASLLNSLAWTSAVMIPKKVFETVGNFDTGITLGAGEDTDLWIRVALKYQVAFSNKVTAIHNLHAQNRISNSNTNVRSFINLDKYEHHAEKNKSLKKYLDINRFSIGLQYRAVGNKDVADQYFKAIDHSNLNKKQKFLMNQSAFTLKALSKLKNFFSWFYLRLSVFK